MSADQLNVRISLLDLHKLSYIYSITESLLSCYMEHYDPAVLVSCLKMLMRKKVKNSHFARGNISGAVGQIRLEAKGVVCMYLSRKYIWIYIVVSTGKYRESQFLCTIIDIII